MVEMFAQAVYMTKSLEDTGRIAAALLERLKKTPRAGASIICLKGNLGSGKTTFVQLTGRLLGLAEHMPSPTFVIEKIYKLKGSRFNHLIHIDAYRLAHGRELLQLGWGDIIADDRNLVFVEWPENVADILPKGVLTVSFEYVDEGTRVMRLECS